MVNLVVLWYIYFADNNYCKYMEAAISFVLNPLNEQLSLFDSFTGLTDREKKLTEFLGVPRLLSGL